MMVLDIQKDKVRLPEVTHAVRASQAVIQYGVGAMVDFVDQTLMTAAPEYWQDQIEKIHDGRLEKVLNVDFLGMPGNKSEYEYGISYVRFPQWYFCPRCRKFQPIDKWVEEYEKANSMKRARETDPHMVKHVVCPACRQELVVARIITACEKNGHIDDFPWVKWVHCRNYRGAVDICSKPLLEFKTSKSASEGLDAIEIVCKSCGARASMQGAFDKGALKDLDEKYGNKYDFSCTGNHPWKHVHEDCSEYPEVLQRGGSSVYFPFIESSLVIPPYSNLLTIRIENSTGYQRCRDTISNLMNMNIDYEMLMQIKRSAIDNAVNEIAIEISGPKEKIYEILERKWLLEEDELEGTGSVKYRAEEYAALSGEIAVPSEEYGDFMRESTNIDEYCLPYIKKISLIHKIREVQALTGFSRIKPVERGVENDTTKNLVSVKEGTTNWYPAYQVRGEGIFIEFDNVAIEEWLCNNELIEKRVELLNENYAKSFLGKNKPRTISAKFLLLHTLSHLLIKQLSFECGYSIASLKERIYCSEVEDGREMAGILIYTASGDSEGTLGGLVRQGRPDVFPDVFRKAMESAMACSNDPVCSLSMGQGRDSLNVAACYSCALIPETSCEEFNVFLDRGVVIGTLENRYMGLYSKYAYGETDL